MDVNYIGEINSFEDWVLENPMNASEQLLWYKLMAYNNRFGWKSEFSLTNTRLCDDMRITRQHLDKCRSTLINKGLISYRKGNGNQCGIYHINRFISVDTVIDTPVDTVVAHQLTQEWHSSLPLNKLNKTKLNNKESKKEATSPKKNSFDEIIDSYTQNEILRFELKEHLKTRKAKKAALTDRAIELSFKSLDKLAKDDDAKIEIVRQSIANGWTGFFELKTKGKSQDKPSNVYNNPQQTEFNDLDRFYSNM